MVSITRVPRGQNDFSGRVKVLEQARIADDAVTPEAFVLEEHAPLGVGHQNIFDVRIALRGVLGVFVEADQVFQFDADVKKPLELDSHESRDDERA